MRKYPDLTGRQFGEWTVLKKDLNPPGGYYICKCSCGTIKRISASGLVRGESTRCRECAVASRRIPMIGKKFGKLTILEQASKEQINQHGAYYICKCECGNTAIARGCDLRKGYIISCGCQRTSYGEEIIKNILNENNISYVHNTQYFKDLILPTGGIGRYDFILLNKQTNEPKILIEFDGQQHFEQAGGSFGKTPLATIQARDAAKNQYAKEHNLPLYRIPYTEINNLSLYTLFNPKYLIT